MKSTGKSSTKSPKTNEVQPLPPCCGSNEQITKAEGKFLSMGPGTHQVPLLLHALNRQRLTEKMKTLGCFKDFILLQGGDEQPFYDTDTTYHVFRQESYFTWAFGVLEPGCYGGLEIKGCKPHLFFPRCPETYAIWMGPVYPLSHFSEKYGVELVHYVDELEDVLKNIEFDSILTLKGTNTDSDLESSEAIFEGISNFKVNNERLFNAIAELRVIKTELELGVMKYVCEATSEAHKEVMKKINPGRLEYQCEADFLHYIYAEKGCRFVSYSNICASGPNSAILHYNKNDRVIGPSDMCLFDMGANYFGYCADITCSYPSNGKFTKEQRLIYEAVLTASETVKENAKAGANWVDLHMLALKTLLSQMKAGFLLLGEVDEMIEAGLGPIFMPCGMGHLMGLDVHDVGGYLPDTPLRPAARGFNKLRTARILQEGMVVTIEPGIYFIPHLVQEAFETPELAKFLMPGAIKSYADFGGVRIEDCVIIRKNCCENMTKVPRTVKEIEDWMAGKQ